jgi:hypothetical protein
MTGLWQGYQVPRLDIQEVEELSQSPRWLDNFDLTSCEVFDVEDPSLLDAKEETFVTLLEREVTLRMNEGATLAGADSNADGSDSSVDGDESEEGDGDESEESYSEGDDFEVSTWADDYDLPLLSSRRPAPSSG